MSKIVFDMNIMKFMEIFGRVARADLKDCYEDSVSGALVFVVVPGQLGKAVGKQAMNVKKLEQILKRKVKIIEYNDDLVTFVGKAIYPLKALDISEEDGIVTIQGPDTKTKGLLIGRNAGNLRNLEKNVKRYFPALKEIKVV